MSKLSFAMPKNTPNEELRTFLIESIDSLINEKKEDEFLNIWFPKYQTFNFLNDLKQKGHHDSMEEDGMYYFNGVPVYETISGEDPILIVLMNYQREVKRIQTSWGIMIGQCIQHNSLQ